MNLEMGDTLSLNGNRHYPMQSVFKFHLALAVLHRVERGELSLDQPYDVVKSDYFEGTVVVRKPGTGTHNKAGMLGAVNDVGILELPNGHKIIVAVFVTHTQASISAAEQPIAEIAKAVYDYYRQ
jgi:beta-lactamase class A